MRKANIIKMTLLTTLMCITCRTEAAFWGLFGKKQAVAAAAKAPTSVVPAAPTSPATSAKKDNK